MKSALAQSIGLSTFPVAVIESDSLPDGALQFKEGVFGCVIAFLKSASNGKTAAFSRTTFGCPGAGVGLGFGDCYVNFPGGIEQFLSTGNPEFCQTGFGKAISKSMPDIEDGERYFKSPDIAGSFVKALPMTEIPTEYILFKPLDEVETTESPKVVVFLVNPDQLSALVVMANYDRHTSDNVITPFASACQNVGIIPFREATSDQPRAVLGLTDVTVRKMFPKEILSFAMPWKLFMEMESNVKGSFLEKRHWQHLLERNSVADK
ncbi:MAG: DUF169 domain-containing protein [Chlorobiaceae bacterium]|nr:DUF169 domain-containing protein [Chlorobiaceae bacterium]